MEMINVKIDEINGVLVTTSNRVAEELGVLHKNLLIKIDDYVKLFNSAKLSAQFYIPSNYISKDGRKVRNYLITKKGIAQLIGGYSSAVERAFELNVAYINKFDEMEKIINSGKQLSIEYPATKDLEKNTFKGIPVMEAKQLCKLIDYSKEGIVWNARCLEPIILKGKELLDYKNENNVSKRRISSLMILHREQVVMLCKKLGYYEELKDIIENYFKVNNKIEYKEERDALGRTYDDRINSTKRMVAMLNEKIDNKLKEIQHISQEINNYREHIILYMSQI